MPHDAFKSLQSTASLPILEMFWLLTIWSKPTYFANLKDELGFPQIAPELCDISEMFLLQDWETGKTSKTFSYGVCQRIKTKLT